MLVHKCDDFGGPFRHERRQEMRLTKDMRTSLPRLRKGAGRKGKDLCWMQAVNFVRSGKWTDAPDCVHPTLRNLGIVVNDYVDDSTRQKLYDLSPRVVDTVQYQDKELWVKLGVWSARRVLHLFEEKYPKDDRPRKAIEAAEAWLTAIDKSAAESAESARSAAYFDFFVEFLDEFERLTGQKLVEIEKARWVALCGAVR